VQGQDPHPVFHLQPFDQVVRRNLNDLRATKLKLQRNSVGIDFNRHCAAARW